MEDGLAPPLVGHDGFVASGRSRALGAQLRRSKLRQVVEDGILTKFDEAGHRDICREYVRTSRFKSIQSVTVQAAGRSTKTATHSVHRWESNKLESWTQIVAAADMSCHDTETGQEYRYLHCLLGRLDIDGKSR
jgi:hypothetical protein